MSDRSAPSAADLSRYLRHRGADYGQHATVVACTLAWALASDEERYRDWLDPVERARYDRIRMPAARARFVTGRALARSLLATATATAAREVRLAVRCATCGGPHGRPHMPGSGLDFSISHCGDVVGVALIDAGADVRVGLDVEDAGPGRAARAGELPGLGAVSLSPAERLDVLGDADRPHPERWRRFARYWCRKEALVKADGAGLELDLTTITVSAPDDAPRVLSWPGAGVASLVDVDVPALPAGAAASTPLASVCVLGASSVRIEPTVVFPLPALTPSLMLNGAC